MRAYILIIVLLLAGCSASGPQRPTAQQQSGGDPSSSSASLEVSGDGELMATGEPQQDTLQEALAAEAELLDGIGGNKQAEDKYAAAIAAMRDGRDQEAETLFKAMTKEFPQLSGPHVNLGILYFQAEKTAQARAAFEKALELNPDSAISFNHLGILSRIDGDFNQALDHYTNALAINLKYAKAHLNMGILLELYMGQLAPALEHYKHYYALSGEKDGEVYGWIVDLDRRLSRK